MGLVSTARVVTRAEYYGRRSVLKPGNREWVTAVETVNALGWVLPPLIIFKRQGLYGIMVLRCITVTPMG